jgi:hypothetical protein
MRIAIRTSNQQGWPDEVCNLESPQATEYLNHPHASQHFSHRHLQISKIVNIQHGVYRGEK